jgi:uncharacterized protein YbjT (DUF2867 family)
MRAKGVTEEPPNGRDSSKETIEMILVVGATGALGGLIARRLLASGRKVRILVRPGSTYQPLVAGGAEASTGDLKEPSSLRAACRGAWAVITTANAASRSGSDTFATVDDEGNQNLITAATDSGVRRFVFVSILGSDPNSPSPLLRAKARTEERLRASGMTFTIIQPDVYLDLLVASVVAGPVLRGLPVTLVGEGRRRHSFVAMQDVAAYAVAMLDDPAASNQSISVGGPEPVSWRDVVQMAEHEVGRPIEIQTIGLGEPVPGLPDLFNSVMTGLEMYDSPLDMREASVRYGVPPTSLQMWAHETFAQAAALEQPV